LARRYRGNIFNGNIYKKTGETALQGS